MSEVLAARITADRASFLVDGEPTGEEFALQAPQWTGIEYSIGAVGPDPALFQTS